MNWEERRKILKKEIIDIPYNSLIDEIISQEQSMVAQLEADKTELLEAFCDLLVEAEGLYMHYPNNFRANAEEFFKYEIKLRDKYTREVE
jgi:hypothetical protein